MTRFTRSTAGRPAVPRRHLALLVPLLLVLVGLGVLPACTDSEPEAPPTTRLTTIASTTTSTARTTVSETTTTRASSST